jgi:DNA polymerase I
MEPLLYGSNPEERIIAVHPAGDRSMRIYTRTPDGVTSRDVEFYPFFFLSTSSYLRDFPDKHWVKELAGTNYFRYLCAFPSWSSMWDAVHFLMDRYNASTPVTVDSYSELPILYLKTDAVTQFLLHSGRTLFKGMEFEELHRLQLDIETYWKPPARTAAPRRPSDDRIILIALSDNRGWEHAISGKEKHEKAMLEELVAIIREKDFDVIEGHNIYNFDLASIMARCEDLGVEFSIGRDGSSPRVFDTRMSFAERSMEYTAYEVAGRHIIDTWLLLQAYDASKRSLESYSLKYAAQHFGFAREGRVLVPRDKIAWTWDNDPETLTRYALDDVRETRSLSELLSRGTFMKTRMLPFNYGTAAKIGSSAKIECLLLREYVRQKHSVPRPETGAQTSGGYTDVFLTGVPGPVIDVDVESLYPSIMLAETIGPKTEPLGVFLTILGELTAMRLSAKRKRDSAATPRDRTAWDALQSSLKTLINSFYGYLGYSRGLFNDLEAADRVTEAGQKLLRQLIAAISSRGGKVIEVDTDGIFFVPPASSLTPEAEREFVARVAQVLPAGITLAVNGRYPKMLSYKKKNYALLGEDGKIKIKGSSLNGRNIEKYFRGFIHQTIEALLHADISGLHSLYERSRKEILEHRITVGDFIRTETLKDSYEEYTSAVKSESRNRSAGYEVAIAAGLGWRPGDKVSYYITGTETGLKGFEHYKPAEEWDPNFPDENTQHYLRRLDETARKFELFFTPTAHRAVFSQDDLFTFSGEGIEILTQSVPGERPEPEEEDTDTIQVDPKIWLDEG